MSSAVSRVWDSFTGRLFPDFPKQWQPLVEQCHKTEGKRWEGKERGTGAADKQTFGETAKASALVTHL